MILRPVRDDDEDAEVVRDLTAAAFSRRPALGAGEGGAAPQGAPPRPADARERGRTLHLARTDPEGCWIAQDEAVGPVGVVLSSRREGTFALSLLAVTPEAQGKGVGKALMARALLYGRACLRGVICGSRDPVAARTYRRAGFTLHPAMRLTGVVDPAGLAPLDGAVHEGTARHRDLMDSVDRRTRGGAHGADHEELSRHFGLLVADDLAGSGYVYVDDRGVETLAATSRRLATRLLTAALLTVPQGRQVRVTALTAEQEWAVDVGVAAGLEIANAGYVCLRGMRPPNPYIPSELYA